MSRVGAVDEDLLDEDEDEAEDGDEEQPRKLSLGRPVLGALEAFERESLLAEEVTTPAGLLYEIRQFLGGAPIAYDPCSCPWSPTRATNANMLTQYRAAQLKLSTETTQSMRYKHNFPGKVTFGDGLRRPFPDVGLTYVFPGFKASKTREWLKKARTESLNHRGRAHTGEAPKVVQQGNELPFAGEVLVVVSLEHAARPWFDYVWAGDAVCFLREPLWFGGAEARSKVGTVLVYYGYRSGRFRRAFSSAGRVMRRKDIKYNGPRSLGFYAPPAAGEERLARPAKPKTEQPNTTKKRKAKTAPAEKT